METKVYKKKGRTWYIDVDGVEKKSIEWAKEMGISPREMCHRIKCGKTGNDLMCPPKTKTKKINANFFDIIDTPEKAYWIGFIWADGFVECKHREGNGDRGIVAIVLKEEDVDHLNKLKMAMQSDHDIYFLKKKNGYTTVRINIINKHLATTLINKYGIIAHRSNATKLLNNIPKDLFRDFCRGILDGDGSFSFYVCKNRLGKLYNAVNLLFGACEDILSAIESFLADQNLTKDLIRPRRQRHPGRDGSYLTIQYGGSKQSLRILSFLYDNATVYLERKYQKYLSIKRKIEG